MPNKPLLLGAAPADIARAAEILKAGGLVGFPTETVYGLGADATDDTAVARLFAAKGRPRFNPLISHIAGTAEARALAVFDRRAEILAEAFWPGPLTLVLPRAAGCPVCLLASAGLASLALRVPAHPIARALIEAAGRPLAAPSANRSGAISPTTAAHVRDSLGDRLDAVLDGGPTRIGIESTVIDLTGDVARLLRPGGVARAAVEALLGPLAAPPAGEAPRAPGLLASHYAPRLPLRLEARRAGPGEALLAFGPDVLPGAALTLNLSESRDLTEAAANLFAHLHALDRPPLSGIAVMPIPEHGLGEAINDRLRRAAAPR
jgi:L-threonylcarbamoyladenylate synthase